MNTLSCQLAIALPEPNLQKLSSEAVRRLFSKGGIAALLVPEQTSGFFGSDLTLLHEAQDRAIACLLCTSNPAARPDSYDGILFDLDVSAHDLRRARKDLGKDLMIGTYCNGTRDDAMVKGEAGIDVLAFSYDGKPENLDPLCEIINWWTDLFVLPSLVIGNIGIPQARMLMKSGADFIAPGEPVWNAGSDPDVTLGAYLELMEGQDNT